MKGIFYFLFFIFLIGNVLGIEGVVPGSYEVDFEPGLEREFVFDFVLDGERSLLIEGKVKDYVEIDKESVVGRESVVVSLKLPEVLNGHDTTGPRLDEPGVSEVWIIAGNVKGTIKVNVPYPKRFVGLELRAPNVNVGEDVDIGMKVLNLGEEYVFVNARVEVYKQKVGWEPELVEVFEVGKGWINVSESLSFELILNGSEYSAGNYLAVAKVDYGDGVVEEENAFRVGEYRLEVLNYTGEFYGGRVNRFEIEVENLWNEEIRDVYIGVRVDGGGGFDTSFVDFKPWEKKILVGFFDAENIKEDVNVEIRLYYGEVHPLLRTKLKFMEGFDWVSLIQVFLIFGIVGFLLWRIRRGLRGSLKKILSIRNK